MTKFTITADKITDMFIKSLMPIMRQATNELFMQIQLFSPVRTGKYISQHRNI